jgi:hypothetical protein
MLYSLDSSALIELMDRYPRDVFGFLWTGLEGLAKEKRAFAIGETEREIKGGDDVLHSWCRRLRLFVPIDDETQAAMKVVMPRFGMDLVDVKRRRGGADPWVIACAMARKDTAVVALDRGIERACKELGIPCLDIPAFARSERWRS